MNFFDTFRTTVLGAVRTLLQDLNVSLEREDRKKLSTKITCEPPRDPTHGDIATNAALILAPLLGQSAASCAHSLREKLLDHSDLEGLDIAGPGFLNLWIKKDFWFNQLRGLLNHGKSYGDASLGHGKQVNVEYVSANPTGPLHVGHCRGAVFGDTLCALLKKAGYTVTKEYYVNDAGAQTEKLAKSLYQRYQKALGNPISDMGDYPGEYLIPVAQDLVQQEGDRWLYKDQEQWLPFFKAYGVQAMMTLIRRDLESLGVIQDVFTSETDIIQRGCVEESLDVLEKQGLLYRGILEPPKGKTLEDWEPREQLLFKSTLFGDDTDRPIQKSDGTWTYFTPDIAYHYDKFKRGSHVLIDVLGSDHGGYVKRITAAAKAVSQSQAQVDVKICQIVKFLDKGVPLKMSKRAGTFIGVQDVIQAVGKDVLRFIMMTRKNDAPLDFDLEKVVEHSKENPVFYVQYAHARIQSVKRHATTLFPNMNFSAQSFMNFEKDFLDSEAEIQMIKTLCQWPRQVVLAAQTHEPHRLAFYLYNLASEFHVLWNKGKEETVLRFLDPQNEKVTHTKLALIEAVALVLASGLEIFGVIPAQEM